MIAFEQAVALPFATFARAETGAEVIKIERPGTGDALRGWDHAVREPSSGEAQVRDPDCRPGASIRSRRPISEAHVWSGKTDEPRGIGLV